MTRNNVIDFVEFQASDLEQVKTFYTRVFGWVFEDYGPEYTAFKDGRLAGGFTLGTPGGHGPLVVIHVENLAAAEQAVKDAGGVITRETFSFPGGARFQFLGPCGNELAVWKEAQ
jgi:predicted enzyme related to lactoylglutathione lyase